MIWVAYGAAYILVGMIVTMAVYALFPRFDPEGLAPGIPVLFWPVVVVIALVVVLAIPIEFLGTVAGELGLRLRERITK